MLFDEGMQVGVQCGVEMVDGVVVVCYWCDVWCCGVVFEQVFGWEIFVVFFVVVFGVFEIDEVLQCCVVEGCEFDDDVCWQVVGVQWEVVVVDVWCVVEGCCDVLDCDEMVYFFDGYGDDFVLLVFYGGGFVGFQVFDFVLFQVEGCVEVGVYQVVFQFGGFVKVV